MAGCLPSFKKKRKPEPESEQKEDKDSSKDQNESDAAQPKNEGEEAAESSEPKASDEKAPSKEESSDKKESDKESSDKAADAKSDSDSETNSPDERADGDSSSDADAEEAESVHAVAKSKSKRSESKPSLKATSRSDTSVSAASSRSRNSVRKSDATSESVSRRSSVASAHAAVNDARAADPLEEQIALLTKERDEAVQLRDSVSAKLEEVRKENESLRRELDEEKQKVKDLESALSSATTAPVAASVADQQDQNTSTLSAAVPGESQSSESAEAEGKSSPMEATLGSPNSFSRHSSKASGLSQAPEFEPVETFTRSFSPAPAAVAAVPAEERLETDEELKKVVAERDALAKQLETAAAFYTSHIQRVTDIYNRVVARAQAAERKKNKYAEKLAELMMMQAANVEGEARELPQPPQPKAERAEVEALRVQNQELEDRLGALIDRCYLLQQELVNAQKCSALPHSQSMSRRSTLRSHQEPSRQTTLVPLSRKSSASTAQTLVPLDQRCASAGSGDPKLLSQAVEREQTRSPSLVPRDSAYEYPRLLYEKEDETREEAASPESHEETASTPSRLGTLRLDFGNTGDDAPLRQVTSRVTFSVLSGQGGRSSPRESLISLSSDMFAEPESRAGTQATSLRTIPEEGGKPDAAITSKQSTTSVPPDMIVESESRAGSRSTSLRTIPEAGEKRAVDLRALERTSSEKGIESFLTQDNDDGNSVLSNFSRRSGLESQSSGTPTRTFPSGGAPVLVTAHCCGKAVKKSDLRNMENCGCTVCRNCLKQALTSSKEDIRNFMGSDPVTGGTQWKIRCPRCSHPQIVSTKKSRGYSFVA